MPCDNCRHLTEKIHIEVPADLARAVAMAKAGVASGAIREVTRFSDGRPLHQDMTFEDLSIDGPWPDIVAYYFACTSCHAIYELSADTYHGSGGAWQGSTGP